MKCGESPSESLADTQAKLARLDDPRHQAFDAFGGLARETCGVVILDVVVLGIEQVQHFAVKFESAEIMGCPRRAQVHQQSVFAAHRIVLDEGMGAEIADPRGRVEMREDY